MPHPGCHPSDMAILIWSARAADVTALVRLRQRPQRRQSGSRRFDESDQRQTRRTLAADVDDHRRGQAWAGLLGELHIPKALTVQLATVTRA